MATFHLRVLTAEKMFFEGDVDRCIVRTVTGDIGILPNHIAYMAPLGIGGLTIYQNGKPRLAAVAQGFIEVSDNRDRLSLRTPVNGLMRSILTVQSRQSSVHRRSYRQRLNKRNLNMRRSNSKRQ